MMYLFQDIRMCQILYYDTGDVYVFLKGLMLRFW